MTTDSDDLGADALANRNAALEAELRVLRAEALRAQGDATGYQVACEWRDKCRAAEAERDRLAAENAALRGMVGRGIDTACDLITARGTIAELRAALDGVLNRADAADYARAAELLAPVKE
jgi:hypothetical protein